MERSVDLFLYPDANRQDKNKFAHEIAIDACQTYYWLNIVYLDLETRFSNK